MIGIEIDDQVYAMLQEAAEPLVDNPNSVLRRLLGIDKAPRTARTHSKKPGDLMSLINSGLVNGGDDLVHRQPRKGRVHKGMITPDGWIIVKPENAKSGVSFSSVSPALKALVGHDINGWAHWTHVKSGKTLAELRDQVK